MKRIRVRGITIVSISFCAVAFAQGPIIISDGPGQSSAQSAPHKGSAKNLIITSDGPSRLPYVYPPPIIISNGPSQLPYSFPSKSGVTISDGPSSASAAKVMAPPKVVIIDGPEPIVSPKPTRKKVALKKRQELPDPETATLAPAIPVEIPIQPPLPTVPGQSSTNPPVASGAMWAAIAVLSTIALFLLALLVRQRQKSQ